MTIARIRGVPILLHPTFLWLVGAWAVWSVVQDGVPGVLGAAVGVAVLFGSVIVHELGHAVTGQALGMPPQSIVLLPFGGATVFRRQQVTPRTDVLVSFAGPLASLALGATFLAAWAVLGWRFLWLVGVFNLALGVLNLIPAFPMDGGRMLRALLVGRVGSVRGTRIALVTGGIFAVFLAVLGAATLEPMLVVMALFMGLMQWRELQAQRLLGSSAS